MVVIVLLPLFQLLSKSMTDRDGYFVGIANFIYYFNTPALSGSLGNSLFVSLITTLLAVSLGFVYAYALTRTCIPAKGFFWGLAMMPLFAPTLLNGIALIYLFGRKGLFTQGFFGAFPGVDIHLYGSVGSSCPRRSTPFPRPCSSSPSHWA